MVSVVTCTAKPNPNLGNMLQCLKSQTKKDFEWVIIDRLLMDRPQGYYSRLIEEADFDVVVKAPKPSVYHDFNLPDISNARNSGIIHSQGDIIVWYDDNMWIAPNHIEKHLAMHVFSSLTYAVGLFWPFSDWNTIESFSMEQPFDSKGKFCREGNFEGNNPNRDHGVRPDDCRAYMDFPQQGITTHFPPYQTVRGSWCYNGNLSFSMELALKINGYDEHLDGSFGGEDVNFGVRADNAGAIGLLDKTCCAYDYRGPDNDNIRDLMPFNWNYIGEVSGNKLTRREFDMIDIQRTDRYLENAYFNLSDLRNRERN